METFLFIIAGHHVSKSAPITLKQWGNQCVFCMKLRLQVGVHVVILGEHLIIKEQKQNREYVADFLSHSPYRKGVSFSHVVNCTA